MMSNLFLTCPPVTVASNDARSSECFIWCSMELGSHPFYTGCLLSCPIRDQARTIHPSEPVLAYTSAVKVIDPVSIL